MDTEEKKPEKEEIQEKQEKQEKREKKERNFSPIFFEVGSKMGVIQRGIHWFTSLIMIVLTLVIVAGVLVSFSRIPGLFKGILNGSKDSLLNLLEYAAEVIIAIELIYVIIAQNLESVVEILMIAFTRELVIRSWDMWEIMLGVVVIAGLFAVRKYLIDKRKK